MIIGSKLLVTAGIAERMDAEPKFAQFVHESLRRFVHHDWGEMCEEDKRSNDKALENNNDRLFAAYKRNGEKIWIITEWDRSATTILFPNEY